MAWEIPLTINPEKISKFLCIFVKIAILLIWVFGIIYFIYEYYLTKKELSLIFSIILFVTLVKELYSFFKKKEGIFAATEF